MMRFIKAFRMNSIQVKIAATITLVNVYLMICSDYITENPVLAIAFTLWPWFLAYIANVIDPLPEDND